MSTESPPARLATGTVTVIGGGLAGITAALDCAASGAVVTLVESRGRLGGAAYSFVRDGIEIDNGQHVFLRCCSAYRGLLARIDASELVTMQPRLDVAVLAPDGRAGSLRRSGLPAPLHLARSLLSYRFLGVRQRLAVAWAMQCLARVDLDDPANDERSFGEWLSRHRQQRATIEAIWELIARPTLNVTVADASLAQAAQVFQVGFLEDAGAGDIGWASVPLSELHDRAAGRALAAAGVDVRLHVGARSLTCTSGVFAVELSDGSTLASDAVVLAVPPARAASLLPPEAGLDPEFAERLGRSAIVNLHVIYDRRVFDGQFAAGIGTPVQFVFDRTASAGIEAGQYLIVSLSAADDEFGCSPEQLREKYLPALAELLPAARVAEVHRFFVTREHSATFRPAPGAKRWRPGPRTAIPGLVLAGSWTDTGWPATMEGAVRSGHTAATAVTEAIDLIPPLRRLPQPDRRRQFDRRRQSDRRRKSDSTGQARDAGRSDSVGGADGAGQPLQFGDAPAQTAVGA